MELIENLIARLSSLCDAAPAASDKDRKRTLGMITRLKKSGLDVSALLTQVPDAEPFDRTLGDDLVTTLTTIAPDDDSAKAVVARWGEVRPGRNTGTPRNPAASDNPATTWVTVIYQGTPIHKYYRNPGAITSLRFPAWETMRDRGLAPETWKKAIPEITRLVMARQEGSVKVNEDYTLEITF